MREKVIKYILFFFVNSLMYLLVDTLEKPLGHSLPLDLGISLFVVAVLSIASLLTDWGNNAVMRARSNISKARFVVMILSIVVIAIVTDLGLLMVMTAGINGLKMSLFDQLLLAVLCQVTPLALVVDLK